LPTPFDNVDYQSWLQGSRESAAKLVPLVIDEITPHSAVDVGCGLGAWLATLLEHGVDDVLGIDGPWVDQRLLEIPATAYRVADLSQPLDIGRRFDLALCLEVAHLLDPPLAERLVSTLTSLSDVVVFSAAIPGQGGLGHLNEQWPRYWAELFAAHGYTATDPFRKQIWEEPDVKWWFAQNTICFVAQSALDRLTSLVDHTCATGYPLPIVHPECFTWLVHQTTTTAAPARPSRLPWRR
jgi:SAM-dependent methyltransferase